MTNEIKDGKLELMGININISQVLGEKLIDQYMAQLSEEDMKQIMEWIQSDFFTRKYDGALKIKTNEDSNSWNRTITLADKVKGVFNETVKNDLINKCMEIVKTKNYQEKINEIAEEIVEYATNGYKEDMKQRVKERLVGNVLGETINYDNIGLIDIINQCIDQRIYDNRNKY